MPRPKATWYRPQDDPLACYTSHGRTVTTTTKRFDAVSQPRAREKCDREKGVMCRAVALVVHALLSAVAVQGQLYRAPLVEIIDCREAMFLHGSNSSCGPAGRLHNAR